MRNRFLAGKRKAANNQGFSLPEILAATTIVTSLCSIAIPTYIEQQKIACQREPESIIAQVMTQTQAYNDEYGDLAQGWSDLDKIATLMTASGPANGNSFNTIELPSCDYTLRGSLAGNLYTFEAERGAKGIAPIDENIAEASESNQPIERANPKVGRNDPCPCGSGKKFKKCCLNKI